MGRARNMSMQQQHTYQQVHRAATTHSFTNGYMTWLKFNESTRNLADSKSVSEREVQNDGLKSRACRGMSCWVAQYTGLKVR